MLAANTQSRSVRNDTSCPARDSAGTDMHGPARSRTVGPDLFWRSAWCVMSVPTQRRSARESPAMALLNRRSSSVRAARCNSPEVALINRARSKGARKRTTQRPPANEGPRRETAAPIWRFKSVRVTDRRAWRLGTTAPHHSSLRSMAAEAALRVAAGSESSTEQSVIGAPSVDNSAISATRLDWAAKLGLSARWCTAK
jgi:hypothetical protein